MRRQAPTERDIPVGHIQPHQFDGRVPSEGIAQTDPMMFRLRTARTFYDDFGDRHRERRKMAKFAIDLG